MAEQFVIRGDLVWILVVVLLILLVIYVLRRL